MDFNAANMKHITEEALGPQQREAAEQAFVEIQRRAKRLALSGKYSAGLNRSECQGLKGPALAILKERFEGLGFEFKVDRGSAVWITWG